MTIDVSADRIPVSIALVRVLDTRSRRPDAAGDLLAELAQQAGHRIVAREEVAGDLAAIAARARAATADCVIFLGGTGLTVRDRTPEALRSVWDLEIPGFGEMFRHLSTSSVGTSALQSRACAGLSGSTLLVALPASPGGVRDAWTGILASQLDSRHRPCNLVEHLSCSTRCDA